MPSSYVSLHHHLVFSTKHRQRFIDERYREPLYGVIGATLNALGAKTLAVDGIEDHVHALVGLKPTHRLADVIREIKVESSKWMHNEGHLGAFGWQDGYGAFAVSTSDLDVVRNYVLSQREHHRKRTFEEEFLSLLRKHGVQFDERYVFR